MDDRISIADIKERPERISKTVWDASQRQILFRSLEAGDAEIFGKYLLDLSEKTQRRFRPHPLGRATAEALCAHIDFTNTIRLVATSRSGSQEKIIAYFMLQLGVREAELERYRKAGITLDPTSDCTLAPSVADAYQDQGLGSLMMRHLISIAHRLGRKHMVLLSGTHETNPRAIHFYEKHSFTKIGTFEKPPGFDNYDMMLKL
jgi:ribosomal protein S18 acetylase RimI-like enzyme